MAANVSPTAHLLRTSRLFSLPPPLRKATYNTSISSTISAVSPTATLPYPSHQAIQTTAACSAEGDWGLKRPLPLKSTTNTTTPIIRVAAIDTMDHITDFESAADHAMSLRKWQEMNISITVDARKKTLILESKQAHEEFRSVFEEDFDKTKRDEMSLHPNAGRWKFKGPWLAGLTEGQFQDYIKTTIRRKRGEFREYIRAWMERDLTRRKVEEARDKGQDPPADVRLSNEEFEQRFIVFRQETNNLNEAIWRFLDLPGSPPRREHNQKRSSEDNSELAQIMSERTAELGPPATHPSAGISYLRSPAHIINHAFLGPQNEQRPILSRVLRATNASAPRNKGRPAIGVGGFVSDMGLNSMFKPANIDKNVLWNNFDPDVPGGSKVWVHPHQALIDQHGRVNFAVRQAEENVAAVWEGKPNPHWKLDEVREAEPDRPLTMEDLIQSGPYKLDPAQLEPLPVRSPGRQGARLPERNAGPAPTVGQIRDDMMQR